MRVVIIGSGNVATVLGRLIKRNEHEIVQVVSRNADHAKALANELQCPFSDNNSVIDKDADLYLVAVSGLTLRQLERYANWLSNYAISKMSLRFSLPMK